MSVFFSDTLRLVDLSSESRHMSLFADTLRLVVFAILPHIAWFTSKWDSIMIIVGLISLTHFLFVLDGIFYRSVWCWLVYGLPVQVVHSWIYYLVLGGGCWYPSGLGAGLGVWYLILNLFFDGHSLIRPN